MRFTSSLRGASRAWGWLLLTAGLPMACGSDGESGDPAARGGAAGSQSQAGEPARAGSKGSSDGGSANASTAGAGVGGDDALAGAAGSAEVGGSMAVAGAPSDAGAPAMGGMGGAGGEGTTPACADRSQHWFDYYHDGAAIRWIGPHGDGEYQPAPSGAPQSIQFPEGSLGQGGKLSARHASTIALMAGSLYRLDGRASCEVPPPPARLTTLSGVGAICWHWIVSDWSERSLSQLIFQYVGDGESCPSHYSDELPTAAVRLEAGAMDEPVTVVDGVRPLIGDSGKLDDVLQITADRRLVRIAGLDDDTELGSLSEAGTAYEVDATSLGSGRYLLGITRASGYVELFVYSSPTHALGSSLGTYYWYDARSLAPDGATARNATYAFFVGSVVNDGGSRLFRAKLDGSAAAQAIAGLKSGGGSGLSVLDVVGSQLLFRTGGDLLPNVFTIGADSDFASPAFVPVISGASIYPVVLSSNRLFYQHFNLAGVVALDGTNKQETADIATWLGCTIAPESDYPNDPQQSGRCGRVHLWRPEPGLTGGDVESYDADFAPNAKFFDAPESGLVKLGTLAPTTNTQPRLVDATRGLFNPKMVGTFPLTAGVYYAKGVGSDVALPAIFASTDAAESLTTHATGAIVWLSRYQ